MRRSTEEVSRTKLLAELVNCQPHPDKERIEMTKDKTVNVPVERVYEATNGLYTALQILARDKIQGDRHTLAIESRYAYELDRETGEYFMAERGV